ncbi:MAG: hypothetical protein ACYCYI_11455 [Saccharofermentanales bacterium]
MKTKIICGFMLVVIIFQLSGCKSKPAEDFTINAPKITGKYYSSHGCLVGEYDGYQIKNGNIEQQKAITKNVIFETNFDGKNEIEFNYIHNANNGVVILNDNDQREENYIFTPIPGKKYGLLEYKQSIYTADIDKGVIERLLLESSEYNKAFIEKQIPKMDRDYFQLTWGSIPQPNISGNRFTYYTNRNALNGGSSNGEIWLKNLDTGKDQSLGEIGVNCLGWDTNDNVYYFNFDHDIISINTNNGKKDKLISGASPDSVLLYPLIVYQSTKNNGFGIYNITDKKVEYVYNDQLKAIRGLSVNPAQTSILFQNDYYLPDADHSKAPDTDIGILNIKDKTIHFLSIPQNMNFRTASWINNEFISIVLTDKTTLEVKTYIVELSYFIDKNR